MFVEYLETEYCCDRLQIFDGSDASGPLIADIRGDVLWEDYTSTSNTMFLLFTSDDRTNRAGFSLHYTCNQVTAHVYS